MNLSILLVFCMRELQTSMNNVSHEERGSGVCVVFSSPEVTAFGKGAPWIPPL